MSVLLLLVSVVIGLLVIVVVAAFAGAARFRAAGRERAHEMIASARAESAPISEADVAGLPEPVTRWLRRSGAIGRPRVVHARLVQSGTIRQDAKSGWMRFEAEQVFIGPKPGFLWTAIVPMSGVPAVAVRDGYVNGRGSTLVKALGLFTMQEVSGPEMDAGALQRYLGELSWLPTAALNPGIRWEPIDNSSARATITDGATTVSGVFEFSEDGDLIHYSTRRYRALADGFALTDQTFTLSEHAVTDGLRVPRRAMAVWHLPEGDVQTIDMKVEAVGYDR